MNDSFSVHTLKLSQINLIDGQFVRVHSDNSIPPLSIPSSPIVPPTQSSSEIVELLKLVLSNQEKMQLEMSGLNNHMAMLEKGKLPLGAPEINKMYQNIEDEFIDLQAGFELQTTTLTEVMQKKINQNACQLSQEIKFVSNQVGELAEFATLRFNDISSKLHMQRKYSSVTKWVHCNWLAKYIGDLLDVPLPNTTYIPRPPQFATDFILAEKIHCANHRPYFTQRDAQRAVVVELE